MQELSTNEKGTRAEGAVLSALLRCGYNVLIPFGPVRYDLVREKDGQFERIQCKTAALTETGALRFALTNNPPSMAHKTYVGEVDFFGVYSPDLDKEPFSSSDFAGLKDVYRVGELPSPSPSRPLPDR